VNKRTKALTRKGYVTAAVVLATLGLYCGGVRLWAQPVNLSDSLGVIFRHKPSFTARIDNRNTFVDGLGARTFGIKAGLTWRRSFTLGAGYHWLAEGVRAPWPQGDSGETTAGVHMRYVALFAEYAYYRRGPWEGLVVAQVGAGSSFLRYRLSGIDRDGVTATVFMYEPAMLIEYKALNLIGIGGGLGYRLMLAGNRGIPLRFTAPVYMVRLRLILPDLRSRLSRARRK
jgi:hypothetical protein